MRHITIIVTLCIAGCSSGTKVSGTVKFDDGSPVSFGIVHFDNGHFAFFGTVKEDGTYSTDIQKAGIPKGTYKVYLNGTSCMSEPIPVSEGQVRYEEIQRVHKKYRSMEETDLQVDISGTGTQVYNVVVKKPQ